MADSHALTVSMRDYSGELSSVQIYRADVPAVDYTTWHNENTALYNAIVGITNGQAAKTVETAETHLVSQAAASSEYAQRELKWRVTYQGDTSLKKFQLEIPTADPVGHLIAGSDLADLTDVDIAAFVTAFEASGRTPDLDTETVTVLEIRLVGRNL